jgi:uncharacterized DUF497 family protein
VDVVYLLQDVTFIWDPRKALANLKKHGVAFEKACEVFFDPFLRPSSPEVRNGEERQRVTGLTADWQLLIVAFTLLEDSVRIISARKAPPLERQRYETQ